MTRPAVTVPAPQWFRIVLGPGCRSWRPCVGAVHAVGHLPGRCRVCWRPCRNPVRRGAARCADCWWALAEHPDPRVRLAVGAAPGVPMEVLELLACDLDPLVADRAETSLGADADAALSGSW